MFAIYMSVLLSIIPNFSAQIPDVFYNKRVPETSIRPYFFYTLPNAYQAISPQVQAPSYEGIKTSFTQANPIIQPNFNIKTNTASKFPQPVKYHGYSYETQDARGTRAKVVFITGATQSEVETILPNIHIFPNIPYTPPKTNYIQVVSKTPASDSIGLNAFTNYEPIHNVFSTANIFPLTTTQVIAQNKNLNVTKSAEITPRHLKIDPKLELQQKNENKKEIKNNTKTSSKIIEAKSLLTNNANDNIETVPDKNTINTLNSTSETFTETTTLPTNPTNETLQENLYVTETTQPLEDIPTITEIETLETTTKIVENTINRQDSENTSVNNNSFETTILPEITTN